MQSPILAPLMALILWSFVMLAWLYATRIPAIRKAKIPMDPRRSKQELMAQIPAQVRWKADNYNHLMEQPTLFYAICLTLALMGIGGGINYWLAWGYVILRVIHSLIQATVNIVPYRLVLFSLATLCLFGLTLHAGLRLLHDCGILSF